MTIPAAKLFLDGRVVVHAGDSRDVLGQFPDNHFHAVITDPPYALVSIVKRFGGPNAAPARDGDVYARASAGFMGQSWDTGETAFAADFWRQILRVLKPGGHVIAASGTRTYHRLACAVEDAGFEIRDMLSWLYGSGFPKSHNVGWKLPDWQGWGTALKPACEPWVVARKPLIGTVAENVLAHGTGALNIGGCLVGDGGDRSSGGATGKRTSAEDGYHGAWSDAVDGRDRPTGGRWPANVLHDGSDEVVSAFPDAPGQLRSVGPQHGSKSTVNVYGDYGPRQHFAPRGDSEASAARFFYTAKADAEDRAGSKHPTIKPLDLMQYLVRLVTPPGGLVLDPFAGTGTTGEAAWREGFSAVLIEREPAYVADIARRMRLAVSGPGERRNGRIAASGKLKSHDDLPLFCAEAPKCAS